MTCILLFFVCILLFRDKKIGKFGMRGAGMQNYFSGMQNAFFGHAKFFFGHEKSFFGTAKFGKPGMQIPFLGLQFTFVACIFTRLDRFCMDNFQTQKLICPVVKKDAFYNYK